MLWNAVWVPLSVWNGERDAIEPTAAKSFLPMPAYIYLINSDAGFGKRRLTLFFSMLMEFLAPFIGTMIWRTILYNRKTRLSWWADQNGNPGQFLPLRKEKMQTPWIFSETITCGFPKRMWHNASSRNNTASVSWKAPYPLGKGPVVILNGFSHKMKIKVVVILYRICSSHRHVSSSEKLYPESRGRFLICFCSSPWNWPCVSHCWQLQSQKRSFLPCLSVLFALWAQCMPACSSRPLPSLRGWEQLRGHALKPNECLACRDTLLWNTEGLSVWSFSISQFLWLLHERHVNLQNTYFPVQ